MVKIHHNVIIMNGKNNDLFEPGNREHIIRPRVSALLAQAVKKPLTIICAGMGCGKTRAVHDFTQSYGIPAVWVRLSKPDNAGARFWDVFVRAMAQVSVPLAEELKNLGFPDTEDKINKCFIQYDRALKEARFMFVFDDFHYINNTEVLCFLEQLTNKLSKNRPAVLISREPPRINISGLMIRDMVSMISEGDLNFTESELNQFLLAQGLFAEAKSLQEIYSDTNGWAFIISFALRILKKSPGYAGYTRSVIKQDISQLIEAEVWSVISERLKLFLLRFSLTDHRSAALAAILAEGDNGLLSELEAQNAFIHFDRYTDSYHINRLFLDFIYAKQDTLTDEQISKTNRAIAGWCAENGFVVDALFHFEKTGDYESIVAILFASHVSFLENAAPQIVKIFGSAPPEVFDSIEFSAAMHIHSLICLGKREEAFDLIQNYEAKYLAMPGSAFKNRMLGCIYYYWGILRMVYCTVDDVYDFDVFFAKQEEYLKNQTVNPGCWYQHPPSLWTCLAGSERAGAPQEYLDALVKTVAHQKNCVGGLASGLDDLCRGELFFYQGAVSEAESSITKALLKAREFDQFEIVYRALFYIIRIAVLQGDSAKFERTMREIEQQLTGNKYYTGFTIYDIICGWYYYILGKQDRIPEWLKEKFIFSPHTNTIKNVGNYVKARYCYMTKDYVGLLSYMEEKKQRHTILFERVELLALEACVHLKAKNKPEAVRALQEAYEAAAPNGIVMPFAELGKDIWTLIDAVAGDLDGKIPLAWLKSVKKRATAYFRNHSLVVYDYKKAHDTGDVIVLSPRETEVLRDLRDGLSRLDIADKYGLSINTVKLHINGIYDKLGAGSRADIFRIAAERKLI